MIDNNEIKYCISITISNRFDDKVLKTLTISIIYLQKENVNYFIA